MAASHDSWDRRSVELADGDVLRYVVTLPGHLECPRLSTGPIHATVAQRLLAELGHPDAELRLPDETATFGPRRPM